MAEELFPSIDDADVSDFAFEDPSIELLLDDLTVAPKIPLGFSWRFDFNKGDLATDSRGEFVRMEDEAVLRDWVGHTLNTERWETPIYGGDIGTDINGLIGAKNAGDSQTMAEVQAEIVEAVNVHDRIQQVYVLGVFAIGYDIYASFQYTTDESLTIQEVVVL